MKHWSCKNDRHEKCDGRILDGNGITGVKGFRPCSCECHRKDKK